MLAALAVHNDKVFVLAPNRHEADRAMRGAGPAVAVGARPAVDVKKMGVLGGGVNARHAIVDPAGLEFIRSGSTSNAGAASGAIYTLLGIRAFPPDVVSAIRKEGQSKGHVYGAQHVVHVVGPDFRHGDATWHDAVERLGEAYASAMRATERLDVDVVRLPVISGRTFAGKFGKADCVPELTARAICRAAREVRPRKQYWLCIYDDDPARERRYELALAWASSVAVYCDRAPRLAAPRRRVTVSADAHPDGAVGFAHTLPLGAKIGLMIAGNSGRPAGGVGIGLTSIPTVDGDVVARGMRGELKTQEESVVAAWLDSEAGPRDTRGPRTEAWSRVFRSTICGLWGQREAGSADTVQGIDYAGTSDPRDYAHAWVVRDALVGRRVATLVFVAGPNANGRIGRAGGSMQATLNKRAERSYGFFRAAVEMSVRAGLLAMRKEGVTHALVALVSCGIYAGRHERKINDEFAMLVQGVVDTMDHAFHTVSVVDKKRG
jgi:hypothetical protein